MSEASFVLDASVAISWCFPGDPTEDTLYSRDVLTALKRNSAIVPEIWAFEIANAIYVSYSRRKRINQRQMREFLALVTALPIRVQSRDLWLNVGLESLARQHDITAYDAAYLALALSSGLALATADERLKKVALAERIAVIP